MNKVSNCCGEPPTVDYESGASTEDFGICPKCLDRCNYVDEWEFDEDKLNYLLYEQARRNSIEDQSAERTV